MSRGRTYQIIDCSANRSLERSTATEHHSSRRSDSRDDDKVYSRRYERRPRRSASPEARQCNSSPNSARNSSPSSEGPRPIWFYSLNGPYGTFSNYFYSPMVIDGRTWTTAEAYFHSLKYPGRRLFWLREAIRTARTPAEAKAIGVLNPSAREGNVREAVIRAKATGVMPCREWRNMDRSCMLRCLVHKFNQNPTLRATLLSTGNAPLIFDSAKDTHWGCGSKGTGRNLMGKLLEETRELMREREMMNVTYIEGDEGHQKATIV